MFPLWSLVVILKILRYIIATEDNCLCSCSRAKKEIRTLENELGRWQVLVDSVTGISPLDFDNQTLAVLKGRLVRYLMRSREVTLLDELMKSLLAGQEVYGLSVCWWAL